MKNIVIPATLCFAVSCISDSHSLSKEHQIATTTTKNRVAAGPCRPDWKPLFRVPETLLAYTPHCVTLAHGNIHYIDLPPKGETASATGASTRYRMRHHAAFWSSPDLVDTRLSDF